MENIFKSNYYLKSFLHWQEWVVIFQLVFAKVPEANNGWSQFFFLTQSRLATYRLFDWEYGINFYNTFRELFLHEGFYHRFSNQSFYNGLASTSNLKVYWIMFHL